MSLSLYSEAIADLPVIVTDDSNSAVASDVAIQQLADECRAIRETQRVFFVGNGGSAAIASHMAADWTKNGGFAALAFNDGAALTCITNDIGFEQVFAMPIERHMRNDDVLFAISSSGESANILSAIDAVPQSKVVTLSGFASNNRLRKRGDLNFYVPSSQYGLVEIKHLIILHAILDHCMGWKSV